MNDNEQLTHVSRVRHVATGLLLLMTALFLLARGMPEHGVAWGFLAAFAEAAMVGALADWFAVTALFRHPLGLPIPHTAIIPNNKDRLADSIADFLENNFMTRAVLSDELGQIDFAGLIVNWISKPEQGSWLARRLLGIVPPALVLLEDVQIRAWLKKSLAAMMATMQLGPILAEILSVLVADRKHQALFDQLIRWARNKLEQNHPILREKVHQKTPRWLPRLFDEYLFLRLLDELTELLDEMAAPDSSWRTNFSAEVEKLIHECRTSPRMEQKLQDFFRQTMQHPLLLDYLDSVGADVAQRMRDDLASPTSSLIKLVTDMLAALAQALERDPAIRQRINQGLQELGANTIARQRNDIVGLIRRVVHKWDARTVSHKIELYVGRDLQYIRINGTLVGGLVGLLLHGLKFLM